MHRCAGSKARIALISQYNAVSLSRPYSSAWYVHLSVAARRGGVHCCDHAFDMKPKHWPLRITNHHNGDFPSRKILLIPYVLVRCDKHLEPGFFSDVQQFAVLEGVPSLLGRCSDGMAFEKRADGYRLA